MTSYTSLVHPSPQVSCLQDQWSLSEDLLQACSIIHVNLHWNTETAQFMKHNSGPRIVLWVFQQTEAPLGTMSFHQFLREWAYCDCLNGRSGLDTGHSVTRYKKGDIPFFILSDYYYIRLTVFFSRKTWVSWHQKGKPFWILQEQEMIGWQWHQLDHMHIIRTSFQTDNHASTSPLEFFLQARCSSCHPTNSVKALKASVRASIFCQKMI